jgi:histidyl-tRNA synthetase
MNKAPKDNRPGARTPRGFRDYAGDDVRDTREMLDKLRVVFERYGYDALETPAIEFTDALGKFLPDTDRPNAGVFSFQDEDEQWMSLRYDMTAPLARHVAENFDKLPKPYRRYAMGPVWRNEKPGPGRYRQFMQCDADTVGTDNVAADAEACMLMADAMEALGIERGQYVVKVNNRKVLDGLLEEAGLAGDEKSDLRLTVMRAVDKLDRLGSAGVAALLGKGRRDESGDFTIGANLTDDQIALILGLLVVKPSEFEQPALRPDGSRVRELTIGPIDTSVVGPQFNLGKPLNNQKTLDFMASILLSNSTYMQGIAELRQISKLVEAAGFNTDRIRIDPSVVRGLDYYTGPVFEAELTFEVTGDDGKPVRFGSVGGGGRYDDLVARFTGQKVPATGFSIGVSRLQAALAHLNKSKAKPVLGPVVVLVMDKDQLPRYQKLAQTLRDAGIRAEMYLGTAGMKPQMKYADKRGAPCVIIQGSQERETGVVQIKDLIEGAKRSTEIKDSKEWREGRPAQVSVPEAEMVAEVRKILSLHGGRP